MLTMTIRWFSNCALYVLNETIDGGCYMVEFPLVLDIRGNKSIIFKFHQLYARSNITWRFKKEYVNHSK